MGIMKKLSPKRNSKKFNKVWANRRVRRLRNRKDTPAELRPDDFQDGSYFKRLDERWSWRWLW